MKTCLRYCKLLGLLAGMQLKTTIIYRMDVLLWLFVSLLWTLFNFFLFSVLVQVRGDLAGWNQAELFVLVGVFTLLDAFIWSWLSRSMSQMTEHIYLGTLDLILVRPVDIQFLLSFSSFGYTNTLRFLLGAVMIGINLQNLAIQPTLLDWVLATIAFFAGLAIVYAFWFFVSTMAFFFDRIENIHEMVPSLRRFMEVPAPVFTGTIGMVFTFIFPLLIVTNVPANILLGRAEYELFAYLVVFALFAVMASRWWFQLCLRRYSGVGS